jgi:hypothetical protein
MRKPAADVSFAGRSVWAGERSYYRVVNSLPAAKLKIPKIQFRPDTIGVPDSIKQFSPQRRGDTEYLFFVFLCVLASLRFNIFRAYFKLHPAFSAPSALSAFKNTVKTRTPTSIVHPVNRVRVVLVADLVDRVFFSVAHV